MIPILLIEDDPFLVDIYSTKLKDSGFKVEVANGGEEGLRKVKEHKFDLVLLDIVLPEMDGWEFLRQLRQDLKMEHLKVIILSNLGQKEEVEKGMNLGATRYLIKAHYTPSQVVEQIKLLLNA